MKVLKIINACIVLAFVIPIVLVFLILTFPLSIIAELIIIIMNAFSEDTFDHGVFPYLVEGSIKDITGLYKELTE